MGKQTNVKLWAMILVVVMVASTFIGFSAMVVGDATAKVAGFEAVSHDDVASAFNDLNGRQLNMNAIEEKRGMENDPNPLSPPPQPETQAVWTYDFDSDTVGLPPAAPPWNNIDTSALGQPSTFGLDDFDDDTLGGMPDSPPWFSVDGSIPEYYWTTDAGPGWESGVIPDAIGASAYAGTDGYFGTFDGSTLQFAAPHAGAPSGSISPGQTTGGVAAELICTAGNNYFGPAGFNSAMASTAYCGSWIYPTNEERIDIIIVEATTWATLIEVALYNNAGNYELVHWPGGTGTLVGQNIAINTWHELMVEYDENADDYSIWWDGSEIVSGAAFMVASDNLDGMIWFAGGSVFDGQVDNWYHGQPPAGFTNNIEVVNSQSASPPHSIYIDQNNVAAGDSVASMSAEFFPMMAGTGYWDYYLRTDTNTADTNGAFAALTNQLGNDVIAVRANGGDFEYNDGGTWTTAMAFAASTWYEFYITFDTVAKTFVLDIEGSVFGPASFATESGTITGIIYRGTGGTQSEHYIDDVIVDCAGQGPEIFVSDLVSHSAPNALKIQEYNAASPCYIAADNLGAGQGAVGQYSFWFYNTENGGGNIMYLLDDGTNMMTIISLGVNLVDYSGMDGQSQFVNNDGAGFWVVDGPTYAPNTWHQVTLDYDCSDYGVSGSTGSFTYSWDGGPPQGPYGMADPVAYLDFIEIDGNAPDTFGDFYYDDFYLTVNEMPGAPTNCWAEQPSGGVETWDNYTVDQDNAVEGTVAGTFNDINEKPPTAPDGVTQDITEDVISGGTSTVTLINGESFEGAWPPAGWTETAGSRWNGEGGPGGLPDGALCADFDGGAPTQVGDLDTPVMDLSDASAFTVDFWYYSTGQSEAGDLIVYYYDGGAWDPIQNLGGGGAWIHYQDVDNNDAQYQHAAFQVRFGASTTANQEDEYIDLVTISKEVTIPPYCSLEHRWRTENVASGGMTLDLFVRARTDAGADDTFSIGIANAVGGPYTPVGITINMNVLVTYSASIIGNSGVLYLNVIDDNGADPAQQDTVYIDAIWIEYYSMGGSVTTTQVAIADNPVDGTVTGTFADTVPPADGSAQTIAEVAAKSTSGDPIEMSPGPGPGPLVDILAPESFEAGFPPAGWNIVSSGADRTWIQTDNGNPYPTDFGGFLAYVNYDPAYAQDEWLITPSQDCSAFQNLQLTYHIYQGTGWNEHIYIRVSTDGGGSWSGDLVDHFQSGLTLTAADMQTLDLSAYDMTADLQIAFILWTAAPDAGDSIGLDLVTLTGDVAGNSMEHTWTMEDMPADSVTRTLYVTARHNTGSDDTFNFGWSENVGGPFTALPTVVVNSDTYTTYSGPIGVAFNGPVYINVVDGNGGDSTIDTLFVDAMWIDSEVSAVSTDIVIHWDLSSDDGAGEDDIVSYDIYRADEEDGDDITGPYVFVGSSPPGATTFNDVGEGADLTNQAWYYVEANDGSQTNASGLFSKLNFLPVAENLLTNGMTGLIISPFTPSITLTANANDTSNQYEAIPKMFMAEYFINVDPGEGSGLPIVPVDAVWDTYIEPLTAAVDSSTWTPGTYTIGVRVAEDDGGATVWGPVSFITVDVVDGPPIANAGFDQTVAQHTSVAFDGSLSTDDVGIIAYWWNFTDGGPQTLTGATPSYTFDFEGIFVVTLTVSDTIGQTNSDIMEVNVTDGDPPVAEAGPNQQITPGDTVNFDGTASYDPGHLGEPIIDGITNWTWTFDDGTGPQTLWGSNPSHQFNIPGVYTVTLTVTDNAPPITGGPYFDTDTMDVTVVQIYDIDISPAAGSDNWILVSFPNQVSGDPLVIVQDAIDAGAGFVTWDIIQTYNATTGEWLTTSTFKPASLNNFNYVDNFHAFWIHITNYGDNLLTITGAIAAPGEQAVVPLKAGWNLVGYPFGTTQEMFNTFGTLFSLDADVEVYDQGDPYRLRIADVWTEWHDPGAGYWVHVAFDEDMWIWSP